MSRWLTKVLERIRELAAAGQLRLTHKALRETIVLDLAPDDVRDVVGRLSIGDSVGRIASKATGEWLCVFKPDVGGQILYVKVILREDCIVVSFHADEGVGHEEEEDD